MVEHSPKILTSEEKATTITTTNCSLVGLFVSLSLVGLTCTKLYK